MSEPFVHSITCSGKAIHQAFARLKPSYPKGSRAERVEVVLWATVEGVRMGLPGGEVSMEAESRGVPFAAAIKFKLFRDLVREEFASRDSVTIEFDDGRLRFGGVTLSGVPVRLGSPDEVGPAVPVRRPESKESVRGKPVGGQSSKTIERPVESLLNEPMGRIYRQIISLVIDNADGELALAQSLLQV